MAEPWPPTGWYAIWLAGGPRKRLLVLEVEAAPFQTLDERAGPSAPEEMLAGASAWDPESNYLFPSAH